MRTYFPDAKKIKNSQKHFMQIMYICSKDINEKDENFDSTEDNEPTFSS